jgi:hypothetical protein
MRIRTFGLSSVIALIACLLCSGANAVPSLLNYQAYLTDDGGAPLSGTLNLEFAIYSSLSGGTALWTEAHAGSAVDAGIFHVVLGGTTALDPALFNASALWLETRVDGTPLVPRRPFLSVPYAFHANVADVALSGGSGDSDWTIVGDDIYHLTGKVGIGTPGPTQTLQVNGSTSRAIYGLQTGTSGSLIGVFGETNSSTGTGVRGQANHATGQAIGVYGSASSAAGFGVYAFNSNPAGTAAYFDGASTTKGTHTVTDGTDTVSITGNKVSGDAALTVDAATNLTATAGQDLSLSAAGGVTSHSTTSTSISAGTTLSLSASTNASLSSSAVTTIAGSMVRMNGNVGIGMNPGFQLQLSTNSAAKPTSNVWTISSDRRLKKNIQPLHGSLERLMKLRGVTYQWKNPETQGGMAGTYPGLIAQEVEPVFPDWIKEDANGYKTLTVIGFEALSVEALRELRTEKDVEIATLRERLQKLEERLARLETGAPEGHADAAAFGD